VSAPGPFAGGPPAVLAEAGAPFRRSASSRAAPGPRGWNLVRSVLATRRDRLGLVTRLQREYGDLVCLRTGRRRLFLLSHPDHFHHVLVERAAGYGKGPGLLEARSLLGDGLLTGAPPAACRDRRQLHPAFGRERLAGYCGGTVRAAAAVAARWREAAAAGRAIDADRDMVALALDVLGSTLLGADLAGRAEAIRRDLHAVAGWAIRRMTAVLPLPATPLSPSVRRALGRLRSLAAELIDRRAAGGPDERRDDLLDLLLAPEAGLSRVQVRDHLLTFLLAGHETVAATLAWLWHLLSRHPEVEARLHQELDRILGDRRPAAADLPRLPYTRAVVEETMRLYPPVWAIPRRALAADALGGVPVPVGSDLLLCVYTLHRHPAFWPDPDRFDPGRFAAGGRSVRAYLPFGVGSRSCLGGRFGLQEAMVTVAVLARDYRLEPIAGPAVEAEPGLTLRPRRGVPLRPVVRGPAGL